MKNNKYRKMSNIIDFLSSSIFLGLYILILIPLCMITYSVLKNKDISFIKSYEALMSGDIDELLLILGCVLFLIIYQIICEVKKITTNIDSYTKSKLHKNNSVSSDELISDDNESKASFYDNRKKQNKADFKKAMKEKSRVK